MARPTEREVLLVSAYVRTGSTKAAAGELGIRAETYRRRLGRVYRRHNVTCIAQLVYVLRSDLPDVTGDSLSATGAARDD